jgi:hypothetical protein
MNISRWIYYNNLFFHEYLRVVFYLMFAYNKHLMELLWLILFLLMEKIYLFFI